ncbi:MAG: hypothetical protein PUE12_09140 [Oscillospiraceae bacterium]|nr:hypothetical protein [Oscillospiraceae bacterium]
MRYVLCYVEEPDKENDVFEVKREQYETFMQAVERYTLLCGCGLCSVLLADVETNTIIRQFFKDDTSGQVIIH